MKKRVFALILVLSMALSLLPLSVMAEEGGTVPAESCTCEETGHTYNKEAATGQCTCCGAVCPHGTDDGTFIDASTGSCTRCGLHINHAWSNGVCACGATCDHTDNTNTTSCAEETICSVCGGTVAAAEHDWQDGQCKNCPATHGHAQEDWTNGVCGACGKICAHEEPADEGGTVSTWDDGVCDVCGKVCAHETFTDDGAPVSAWENGVCTVCGKQQKAEPEPEPEPTPAPAPAPTPVPTPVPTAAPHTHSYTGRVTTAAGCVTPGVRTYTCSCGASYTEAISATGHDWDEGKVELVSGDNSLRVDIACVCKNCGATQSMQHDSVEASLMNRARDNQVTVVSDMPEAVEVKGTVLPNGGTAYVIRETVAADGEAAESISLRSENEDIRYVGYQRTDEKGVATETLELNAAKGLASVDILRGELENGTPTVTVKENGKLIDLKDVSAALDGEQLSYSMTTENGSEWGYSTGSTVSKLTESIKQIKEYWEGIVSRNIGDSGTTAGGNVSVEANKPLVVSGGVTVSPILLSEKGTTDAQSDSRSEQPNYGDHGELVGSKVEFGGTRTEDGQNDTPDSDIAALQLEVESLLEEMSSVRDGGYTYLETSNGGVIVPSGAQTGEGNNEDTLLEPTATPAPSATPTPTPAPEATEDVWVTISFETKTLYEDDTTIATVEDDSPTIVRFVDTTPTPAPIQAVVTPDPTPEPTPTPIPTYDVDVSKFLFTESQKRCDSCGEWYYPSQGHSCKKCVPSGTMITLADGTKKAVESLTAEDICLVFDHESGGFTTAGILFLENDGVKEYTVVNLEFSDGSVTRLIDEHGYFDLDEMGYVYIHADNCLDYIGHRFYKAEIADGEYVPTEATLVKAYVTEEVTGCYSFPTAYYLNFFADGFLSMPGGIAGMFNFFDYDDDLAYNAGSMTEDIAAYGVFEYGNLADILTREEFARYPAQYLNVALGKGLLTQEDLEQMIARYVIDKR